MGEGLKRARAAALATRKPKPTSAPNPDLGGLVRDAINAVVDDYASNKERTLGWLRRELAAAILTALTSQETRRG